MEDEIHEEKEFPSIGIVEVQSNLSQAFSNFAEVDLKEKLFSYEKRIKFEEAALGKDKLGISLRGIQLRNAKSRFGKFVKCVLVCPSCFECLTRCQRPDDFFLAFHYIVILLASIYNFCVLTFRICYLLPFEVFQNHFYTFYIFVFTDLVADYIYTNELVILGWLRPYYRRDGILEEGSLKTSKNYLKRRFCVDFLSFLPLDYLYFVVILIVMVSSQDVGVFFRLARFLPLFRVNRILRLFFRYWDYFHFFESHIIRIPPFFIRISKYYIMVLLCSHLMACLWHIVVESEEYSDQNGIQFSGLTRYPGMSIWEIHLFYFHWVYVLVSGYGGTFPASFPQILYACGVVASGIVINVALIGIVSSIVSDVLNADSSKRQDFEKVKLYMNSRGVDRKLRKQIIRYYSFMFENERQWDEKAILRSLPGYLRTEVAIQMNSAIVQRVKIFQNASKTFISSVVLQLQPRFVLPCQEIIKQGEVGREMYFLTRGRVSVEVNGVVVAQLNEGCFFGEIALLKNAVRNATIRAQGFCDLYVLTKESFKKLESEYPREVGWIRAEALERENAKESSSEEEKEEISEEEGSPGNNNRKKNKKKKKKKKKQEEDDDDGVDILTFFDRDDDMERKKLRAVASLMQMRMLKNRMRRKRRERMKLDVKKVEVKVREISEEEAKIWEEQEQQEGQNEVEDADEEEEEEDVIFFVPSDDILNDGSDIEELNTTSEEEEEEEKEEELEVEEDDADEIMSCGSNYSDQIFEVDDEDEDEEKGEVEEEIFRETEKEEEEESDVKDEDEDILLEGDYGKPEVQENQENQEQQHHHQEEEEEEEEEEEGYIEYNIESEEEEEQEAEKEEEGVLSQGEEEEFHLEEGGEVGEEEKEEVEFIGVEEEEEQEETGEENMQQEKENVETPFVTLEDWEQQNFEESPVSDEEEETSLDEKNNNNHNNNNNEEEEEGEKEKKKKEEIEEKSHIDEEVDDVSRMLCDEMVTMSEKKEEDLKLLCDEFVNLSKSERSEATPEEENEDNPFWIERTRTPITERKGDRINSLTPLERPGKWRNRLRLKKLKSLRKKKKKKKRKKYLEEEDEDEEDCDKVLSIRTPGDESDFSSDDFRRGSLQVDVFSESWRNVLPKIEKKSSKKGDF